MKTRINNLINLIKQRDYRKIAFRLLSLIPSNIFVYNRFYFVYCHKFETKHLRPLKREYTLKVTTPSKQQIEKIKLDLGDSELNWAINHFRITRERKDTKVLTIEKDTHCIAVVFVRTLNKFISPSGFPLDFDDHLFATWILYTQVHPDFRLKGYHVNLLFHAYQISQNDNSLGLFGEIHYMNRASIQSHAKLGFNVYKNVQYVKIIGKTFFWETKNGFWCVKQRKNTHPQVARQDILNH